MTDHLQRRGKRYYIRRRIPQDLVSTLGKTIVQQALGTADPVQARKLCRARSVELDQAWDAIRQGKAAPRMQQSEPASIAVSGGTRGALLTTQVTGHVAKKQPARGLCKAPRGLLITEVVERWARERKPVARTVGRTERIVSELQRAVGVSRIDTVSKLDVLKYKDWLLEQGQTPGNINVKIPMLGVVFNYAVDNALISANPASRVRVDDKRRANEKRLNFESEHLQAIFSGSVYMDGHRPKAGGGEAAYWLPLLALYTGARLNELGQLRPEDIYEESYTDPQGQQQRAWVIRVTAD